MKTIFYILAAALLCGCNKPAAPTPPARWEYIMLEIENSSVDLEANAYKKTPIDLQFITFLRENAATFDFPKNTDELNRLGTNGWELVSATPLLCTTYPESDSRPFIRTEKVLLILRHQMR